MKKSIIVAILIFVAGIVTSAPVPVAWVNRPNAEKTWDNWIIVMTNSFNKTDLSTQQILVKFAFDKISHEQGNTNAPIENIKKVLVQYATQEWFDKAMKFPECKYSFRQGIVPPVKFSDEIGIRFENALKANNRLAALDIYKNFNGVGDIVEFKDYMTPERTIEYANTEMYWDVQGLGTHLALMLIGKKSDQLIDNGYTVWYDPSTKQKSPGADALIQYVDEVVRSLNRPYFLGLNSRLKEVGCKTNFDPVYKMNPLDVSKMAKDYLYWRIDFTKETKWEMVMALGIDAFNELIDKKVNGDVLLQEKTNGDPTKVRAK